MHHDFAPDAARARRLDLRMRAQFADSVAHLADAVAEASPAIASGLLAWVRALREGRQASPAAFGIYYEAAAELLAGHETQGLAMLAELARQPLEPGPSLRARALDAVAPADVQALYQRLMDTDPATPFRIVAPPQQQAREGIARFDSAMTILRACAPGLAGEVDALLREVVFVAAAPDLGYDFAGGSSYMLWGALFLNAACHADDVAMVEAIAHECGHSLLFGFTVDEPLVLNEEAERYASPLRDDPRPMDGIYHATFVSARMHWAMSRLFAAGDLDPQSRMSVLGRLEADRRAFWSGYATVAAEGRLSATGADLMASARAYMLACAPD